MRLWAFVFVLCAVGCTSSRDPVAVVHGDRIDRDELQTEQTGESLSRRIFEAVMRRYLDEHDLTVSDDDLIDYLKHGFDEPIADELLDKEGNEFFRTIIESRLFAKSLFEEYGGRVTISSFGFVGALDAQEAFLREEMQDGAFTILDPELEKAFWIVVTNEWGDVTLSEDEARKMFNQPDFPMDR